jgi:hypothetical protein
MRIVKFSQVEDATIHDDELGPAVEPPQTARPVWVNTDTIRSFSARKGDRVGTRLVFVNGIGLPISETCDEVAAALATH